MNVMNKEDTISFIRSLLISRRSSYCLPRLLQEFRNETGYDLPLFGYKTPVDFLKSIPDSIQLIGVYPNVQLTLVKDVKSNHIATLVKRQNSAKSNTHRKKSNFDLNGGWTRRLKSKSKKLQKNLNGNKSENTEYDKSKDRPGNSNNLLLHRSSKKKYKCEAIEDKSIKFGETKRKASKHSALLESNREIERKYGLKTLEPLKNKINCKLVMKLDDIPKLDLKCHAITGEDVEVFVSDVCSPVDFSLQLWKNRTELCKLMHQLQSYYFTNFDNFKMSTTGMSVNHPCVALIKHKSDSPEWYRAVILDVINESCVKIKLLDFGSVVNVDIDKLRYLIADFGKLSAQAFSGCVAQMRAFSLQSWSHQVCEQFKELVLNKNFVAKVVTINYKDLCVDVALTSVGAENIIGKLIEKNFAAMTVDQTRHNSELTYGYKHPSNHLVTSETVKELNSKRNEFILSYSESNRRLKELFLY